MSRTIIAFDLYGTLLSTASVAGELKKLYGDEAAKAIATKARTYQLEYTWRVNSMQGASQHRQVYQTFEDITKWSFRHAAAEHDIVMTQAAEDSVLNAYNGLDTFPDAEAALKSLADFPQFDPYIFSNGTASMLTSSMDTSPALSKSRDLLPASKVISVEPLRLFKPDPRTYEYLAKVAGKEDSMGDIWLISSNPFDAMGAVAAGIKSAWVGRGAKWTDGLAIGSDLNPTLIAQGVDDALQQIANRL